MAQSIVKQLSLKSVKSGFHRLEKREKWFVAAGMVVVVGFLLLQGVIIPYLSAKDSLRSSLDRKRQEVLEMALLQQEYRELKARQGGINRQIEQRNAAFSLFSYLEKQATDTEVRERVTYMRPSFKELDDGYRESAVELKMEMVSLERLIDFMNSVESTENVVVTKRISIQQNNQEKDLLDVVVTIVTFEKQEKRE